jgi:hypothetical protein
MKQAFASISSRHGGIGGLRFFARHSGAAQAPGLNPCPLFVRTLTAGTMGRTAAAQFLE